jgi:fucose 4-O-acetylase-like acetyltransferase
LSKSSQDLKRPFGVTLLSCLVLIITIVHLVRLIYAITWWRFLATLPGKPPLLLALTGLIGFLLGAALSWELWFGNSRAPLAARILIPVYLGWQWLEQVLAVWRGNRFENWPFMTVISLVVILFTYLTLSTSRAKLYFGEMDEPSKKD